MNKTRIAELVRTFTRNKSYQFLFALLIGCGIVYGAYHFAIADMIARRSAIEKRISNTDPQKLRDQIETLETRRDTLIETLKTEQAKFESLSKDIYATHYPIMMNILDTINRYAFNIYSYQLASDFAKMDVTLIGSYQNLIRFMDYLGHIPADVTVSTYKITLTQEHMMKIELTIAVEPIKL